MSERDRNEDPVTKVVNRHMARMLSGLEEAGCPAVFRDYVRAQMQYLRSDLQRMAENEEGDKG